MSSNHAWTSTHSWALAYVVTKGTTDAFVLSELLHYLQYEQAARSPYTFGFGWGTSSLIALPFAVAMVYYVNKNKKQCAQQQQQQQQRQAHHDDDHDHHHDHHPHDHHHHHSTKEKLVHVFGLTIPLFALGFAGGFMMTLMLMGQSDHAHDHSSDIDVTLEQYLIMLGVGILNGAFYCKGESMLHETFLNHAHDEHGSFFKSFYDVMWTKVFEKSSVRERVKDAYVKWGSYASHVSAQIFELNVAANLILALPLKLFFNVDVPHGYVFYPMLVLAIFGAAVHNHSEAKAYEEEKVSFFDTYRNNAGYRSVRGFLIALVLLSVIHTIPELLGIPEAITQESWGLDIRLGILGAATFFFAIPDMFTSISLACSPCVKTIKSIVGKPLTTSEPGSIATGMDIDMVEREAGMQRKPC